MKGYCNEYLNQKFICQNYYKIACCLSHLLELYDLSNNNLLTKQYGILLLRTLNHYNKEKQFFTEDSFFSKNNLNIIIEMISKLIEIITQYSSYYYFNNRNDYVKLLIKIGFEIIKNCPFKNEKKILKRKNALINNISCLYEKEKRYDKAQKFLDKNFEMNKNKIDNAISYNNYGIIEYKKKNIILSLHYFHLMFKEIKDIINEDYQDKNNNETHKLFSFLMLNYFSFTKKYSFKDYIKDIDKGLQFTNQFLGENNYITVKLIRLKEDNLLQLNSSKNISLMEGNFSFDEEINKKKSFHIIIEHELSERDKMSIRNLEDKINESFENKRTNSSPFFDKIENKIQKEENDIYHRNKNSQKKEEKDIKKENTNIRNNFKK